MTGNQKLKLTGVSRTAIFTLRGRAEENAREDGLFRDPHAAEWFEYMPWDAELEEWYDWSYQVGISVRTKLLDNIARQHLESHSNSLVVELGSGLSSRYYRLGEGKPQWFELDLPEVIDIRLHLDQQSQSHRFIAASVMDWTWMAQIPDRGAEEILFIAEGLFYYFEEWEVKQLVQRLRERFAGATLAFDVGGRGFKQFNAKKAAQLGAPMKWFVKDERDVEAWGLSVVNSWPLLGSYSERWGYLGWLYWWLPWGRTFLRTFCLILSTRLNPVDEPHPC